MAGCSLEQRAAVKLIDPTLAERGGPLERTGRGQPLVLGDLRVEDLEVLDWAPGEPPLPPSEGRARPAQRQRLRATVRAGTASFEVDCLGARRQPRDADFAAAADERRDEIAIECSISNREAPTHRFHLEGALGRNLQGQLAGPEGSPVWTVELLRYVKVWRVVPREIPVPLAQVRDADGAVAAMPLGPPERVWMAPRLDDASRARTFAVLVALRFMPLGWSD